MENIQSTLENLLSKYKQKSLEIDIQTKDGASMDDWKTHSKLRRELYKEYVKDVKGNYYGFFYPVSYKDFFKLIQEEQKG